ncbi:hypothetical protein YC2023_008299 [Brassica napus]
MNNDKEHFINPDDHRHDIVSLPLPILCFFHVPPSHYLSNMMMVAMVLSMGLSIGEPIAACYFIFGDSLVDSGKQQSASILSKSRFCNGKTTVDVISLLGYDDLHYTMCTSKRRRHHERSKLIFCSCRSSRRNRSSLTSSGALGALQYD